MNIVKVTIVIVSIIFSSSSFSSGKNSGPGLSINEILKTYSQKTSTKILVDPRVKGRVTLIGQSVDDINYENLLTLLGLHDYTAYKSGEYLIVTTIASARSLPLQKVMPDKKYPENLFVTDVIKTKKTCAVMTIPILRSLVAKEGHMAASMNANSIVVTDRYSNIQKIKKIISQLDSLLDKKQSCGFSKS